MSFSLDDLTRSHVIEIPPKYAIASVIRFLKGKNAIAIARQVKGKQRNFSGENFWARGYAVSTVLTFPAKSYNHQIARVLELDSIPNNLALLRIARELAGFSAR